MKLVAFVPSASFGSSANMCVWVLRLKLGVIGNPEVTNTISDGKHFLFYLFEAYSSAKYNRERAGDNEMAHISI